MTDNSPDEKRGVPLWMPLVGLMAAFLVALLAGASICPTLSALVLPPGPRLPPGQVVEQTHESKAAGEDEWLYGTNTDGCTVAQFYLTWLGDCTFSPTVDCKGGKTNKVLREPGQNFHVATCTGKQAVGNYDLAWSVYIDSGEQTGAFTVFRLIREVAN